MLSLLKIWRNSFSFRFAFAGRRDGQANSPGGDSAHIHFPIQWRLPPIPPPMSGLLSPQTQQLLMEIPMEMETGIWPPWRQLWPWQKHASALALNLGYFGRVVIAVAVAGACCSHGKISRSTLRKMTSVNHIFCDACLGLKWCKWRLLTNWPSGPIVHQSTSSDSNQHFILTGFLLSAFFCDLMGYDVLGGQWPLLASWGVVRSGGGPGQKLPAKTKRISCCRCCTCKLWQLCRCRGRWRYFSAFPNDAWRRRKEKNIIIVFSAF